jgi:hypothetical protein
VVALALTGTVICIAHAGHSAEPSRDEVAALIARLSSSSRAERVEAERVLSEGDIALLDQLPQREEISDPAAQLAVDRIRARLQERRALQDALPTMIAGDRVHTLGDLAAASHSHVVVSDVMAAQHVNLPHENLSLWQAVDAVAKERDLWPVVSDKIRFRKRTPRDAERSVTASGAFRIVASPVRLKPIAGGSDERLARVTLELQAEPKLRPLFLSHAGDEIALASDGKALLPFSPKAKVELPFGEGERTASFPLDYVATKQVAPPFDISGRVVATVAAGEERFAFPLSESGSAKRSRAGVTVELHKFAKTNDGGAIAESSVVYDAGGPAFESHRTWVYHNEAYLTFTRSGENRVTRLNHEPGFSTLAISSGGVKLGYRFANLPSDAKDVVFNYEAPTKIVNVPVEFELHGLRLQE